MSLLSLLSAYVDRKIEDALMISEEIYQDVAWKNGHHYEVMSFRLKRSVNIAREGMLLPSLLGLVSDYYGQGNRLLRQGKFLIAFEFYRRAFACQKDAELVLAEGAEVSDPIDYEVLGAPSFFVASIPVIGRLSIEWRRAIYFLQRAVGEYDRQKKKNSLGYALVWAKIFSLTKGVKTKGVVVQPSDRALEDISKVKIDDMSDQDTVARIARHLGMTKAQLYELCKNGK